MSQDGHDHWVFGYGSLMWRPGFDFAERVPAYLVGFERSFCIFSNHHRGNDMRPGLVLGLDRGGACAGIAYRVTAEHWPHTVAYLRAREQVSGVYQETSVPLTLADGTHREVSALTYIVERAHPSYAHRLPFAKQVDIIRGARGLSGPNVEYLVNTARLLRELGIPDRGLERLVVGTGGLFASASADEGGLRRRALLAARFHGRLVRGVRRMSRSEHQRFMYRQALS